MTMRYAHLAPDGGRELIALLDEKRKVTAQQANCGITPTDLREAARILRMKSDAGAA
jgi:hypothetical protein